MKIFHWLWKQPVILMSLTCLFWGGNTIAARIAVDQISPYQVTFGRWSLVSLGFILFYRRQIWVAWQQLRGRRAYLFLMGASGFVLFNFLFYESGHRTTAINIGILQGSIPIFVLIGAFFVYKARITWLQLVGVLLGFIGVFIVATGALPSALLNTRLNIGDLMMTAACLVWAGFTIGLRNKPPVPSLILFAMFCMIASLLSAPFAIYEVVLGDAKFPTLTGWFVLLYIAVCASTFGQLFYLRSVDLMGPSRTGMFLNLIPIVGALLAIGILGESFFFYHGVALLLILGGLWISREPSPK